MTNYEVIANTKDLSQGEWLGIRKKYIGGSDAGAIVGLDKWRSPIDVWKDKRTPVEEQENYENEAMRQGTDFEDYVARRFSEATGKRVRRDNGMMVSKNNPYMLADIDRRVVGENSILECKTAQPHLAKAWEDGQVPPSYYCQVQHYLTVTGAKRAYIAVLIYGRDFIWYQIDPNEPYQRALIEQEGTFYRDNMVRGLFPTPDGSKASNDAIKDLYPGGNKDTISLPEEADEMIKKYLDLDESIKGLKKDRDLYKQKLQIMLGDHEVGKAPGYQVKWTSVESNQLNKKGLEKDYPELVEEYTNKNHYRRFSIREEK